MRQAPGPLGHLLVLQHFVDHAGSLPKRDPSRVRRGWRREGWVRENSAGGGPVPPPRVRGAPRTSSHLSVRSRSVGDTTHHNQDAEEKGERWVGKSGSARIEEEGERLKRGSSAPADDHSILALSKHHFGLPHSQARAPAKAHCSVSYRRPRQARRRSRCIKA